MFKFIILWSLILPLCSLTHGQSLIDIAKRQNIRSHALDNVKEFENLLNEIVLSNNPEEKKLIVLNSKESVIDSSADIEDDLNPDKSISGSSDFIKADTYLERFPLLFNPENSIEPVSFSNVFVSDVRTDEYTYISIYFESLFTGIHKVTNKKFRKVSRLATIKIFSSHENVITKIINIKFANTSDYQRIKKESLAFEKEFQNFQETSYYKKKRIDEEYQLYIDAADHDYSYKLYNSAKEKYQKALNVKPEDPYASAKIQEIKAELIQQENLLRFKEAVESGDLAYKAKEFYAAKSSYERALQLLPSDPHVKYMLTRIDKKLNPLFPRKTTGYLGVNYSLVNIPTSQVREFESGFDNENTIGQLGLSFYYPIGLYVSGIKIINDKIPDNYYSLKTIDNAKMELRNSQTSFTDLTFSKQDQHTRAFNAGIYLSCFRPIYFKLGISYHYGSRWDLYDGDLVSKIKYSTDGSGMYAANYQSINKTDGQIGLAVVVPYFQIEFTYDNYFQSFQMSAGLNYPFKNIYILRKNPDKQSNKNNSKRGDSEIKFPYSKTRFVSLSYNFLSYDVGKSSGFKLNSIVDSSFTSPILEKFTFSFYWKIGFFVSGIKKTSDKVPNVHYSESDVNNVRSYLVSSGTSFTELKYIGTQSNLTQFNLGISFCLFRPLHFKVGTTLSTGYTWAVYSGDFKGYLSKFNGSNYYAIDYKDKWDNKFVGGLALVFPYFQMELMYNNFYNKITLSAGLNIPIVKK
jgi:hypothetical protein